MKKILVEVIATTLSYREVEVSDDVYNSLQNFHKNGKEVPSEIGRPLYYTALDCPESYSDFFGFEDYPGCFTWKEVGEE